MTNATVKDAVKSHWVQRLPESWLPYAQLMRLERPIGWWLLLLPCWWAMTLAQLAGGVGLPNLWHAAMYWIGAIVMRGAGCVVNDLADHEYDAKVDRTANRPLPSGRVSRKQAFAFLAALLLIGLIVVLQFNRIAQLTAIISLGIVAIYPFMKRVTYLPQLVLGVAFNWGALVGWVSETGSFSATPFWLFAGGIAWTMAYDTIYAHQDKEDDVLIGVKSTALLFGQATRPWLALFFAMSLAAMEMALHLAQAPLIAHIGLVAAAFHALWQLSLFDGTSSATCLKLFRANRAFGLFILFGMIAGCLIR